MGPLVIASNYYRQPLININFLIDKYNISSPMWPLTHRPNESKALGTSGYCSEGGIQNHSLLLINTDYTGQYAI